MSLFAIPITINSLEIKGYEKARIDLIDFFLFIYIVPSFIACVFLVLFVISSTLPGYRPVRVDNFLLVCT